MTSLSQLLAEEVAAFDAFKVDEYGKWKIGRAEAKEFLKAHDTRVLSVLIQELGQNQAAGFAQQGKYYEGFNDGRNAAITLIKSVMKV